MLRHARTQLPPGPRLPDAAQTAIWITRPLPFLAAAKARYGDIFTIRLLGMGPMVMVAEPSAVKAIYTGTSDVLLAGEGNAPLAPLLGEHSLLILDKQPHLRQRRLLLPPFHGERMQSYGRVMRDLSDESLDTWPMGEPFSAQSFMQQITVEVILRTVFGLEEGARKRRLKASLTELLDAVMTPTVMLLGMLRLDLFQKTPWLPLSRRKASVDAQIFEEIAIARRDPRLSTKTDVLSMMLNARDEEGRAMSDQEVRDELMTLLIAGHETTATALSWAFERILSHEEVGAKIEAELTSVVGDGPLEPEQISKLDYLDAVVKESLRTRPILPMVVRRLDAPFQVGGWELPKGVRVSPCIWLSHHREESFPEPERFLPERFLGKKTDPYAWFPFGGGVRRCIGMAFALYEMKTVLATILLRAKLRLAKGRPLDILRRSLTLAPEGGTEMVLVERRPIREGEPLAKVG